MWKTSVWRLGSFAQALIRPASRVPLDWKTSVWRLGSFAQALIRPASRVHLTWKTPVWRLGSFAQAVISARLNVEDTSLAVGLLRASGHPTCLTGALRLGQ